MPRCHIMATRGVRQEDLVHESAKGVCLGEHGHLEGRWEVGRSREAHPVRGGEWMNEKLVIQETYKTGTRGVDSWGTQRLSRM